MTDLIAQATKDAEYISRDLVANYPGRRIKKSTMRIKYDLPTNRGVIVFQMLVMYYNFIYGHYSLGIPITLPKPKKENVENVQPAQK